MGRRQPVLARPLKSVLSRTQMAGKRCAASSKAHGVLRLHSLEAKLEKSIRKAYLVLTLRRKSIATAWAEFDGPRKDSMASFGKLRAQKVSLN